MPRQARIDAPGALHHVIARGIERRKIFLDDKDRDDFLTRLGTILVESDTRCYAWSLIPNHFHLLLKTGTVPVATVMRRLLTGYAVRFNHRHRRRGHLFQNRYKSILCQEDVYLKELVRYIHLNPLRAKIVEDLKGLDAYPYCGHRTIMKKSKLGWQAAEEVLGLFDARVLKARRLYRQYVEKGIDQGRRPDLMGGGLVRSAGGWTAVRSLRKAGFFFKSDERILGDSGFAEEVLENAQETMERTYALAALGVDFSQLVQSVAGLLSIPPERVIGAWKSRDVVKARRLICYLAAAELGLSMTQIAKELSISVPTVSVAAKRGQGIASENGYSLPDMLIGKI